MKRKTLITSILVIVLCLALISGSTYSLFTSESSVNMVVTSGKVDVSATVTDLKVYSATADPNAQLITTDLAGEIQTGPFAGTYHYQGPLANNTFANGGTAAWATDTKVLTIDKITPGDKVTLNVDVQNNSNVAIQYRVRVNVLSGLKLYEGLVVKTDNISLSGVQKVGNWTYLPYDANTTALATIPVEIYLPLEAGNTYQDLSTSLRITVEAVQGNAKTTNDTLNTSVNVEKPVANTAATQGQVITDNDQLVEVSIPATAFTSNTIVVPTTDDTTTSLSVKIEPQDTISDIVLTSTQTSQSYDLEVLIKTQVGTADPTIVKYNKDNEPNATALKIKMFVGTGLTGVKLYHKTTPLTTVATLSAVDELNEYYYDSTEGYITLMTNSFSEYTVVYNRDIAVEKNNTITVYTPTETPNVYEDGEGNVVQITVDENNELNIDDSNIAYIKSTTGTTFYKELGAAFLDLSDNETLVLMKDVESNRCYLYSDEGDATFDLNGFTLKVTGCDYKSGDEVYGYTNGGRAVKVTNGALCIKNGTIDGRNYVNGVPTANPSTTEPWSSTRLGGCVRINGGDVVLEDLTMYNNDGWGNSVKLESNNSLTMNNCTIISVYGACIEIGSGVANITNCDFVETMQPSPSYHAACIAVCNGGTINLLGKNTANGVYALFVYSTGGTINVADGSFVGSSAAIYVDAGENVSDSRVNVSGGTYTGDMIVSAQSNGSYKAYLVITGGTFDHDPTAYVQDGYGVNFENEKYTVYSQLSVLATQLVKEGYTNVSLNLEEGCVLGTYTDDVVYRFEGNDVIYVHDATNYNGYYDGEATSDITTYYVGKLVPVTNIDDGAFNNATNTTKLVITKNLSSARKVLQGNTNITTVEFGAGVTKVNDRLFYRSNVSTVILTDSITTIESGAFFEAHSITELNIPASVTSIGDQAFAYCDSLTTITINGSPTIDLYFIGRACDSLTNVWFNGTPTFTNSKTTSQTFTREESGQSYPIVIHFTTQELLNTFDAIDSSSTGLTLEVINQV